MNRQALSALFDGECKGAELDLLLDELERDPSLRSEWSRLCVARESLQGKARRTDEALVRNVMAAIARDAAVPARRPARTLSWTWMRPLAAYSMAAAVGAVAVLSVLSQQKSGTPAQTVAMADYQDDSSEPVRRVAMADAQLSRYLNDYNRTRAQQGMGGSLGYARVAARNAVYHPSVSGN